MSGVRPKRIGSWAAAAAALPNKTRTAVNSLCRCITRVPVNGVEGGPYPKRAFSKKDEQFTPIPHDLLILSHFTGRRTGKQRDVPVIPDSIWLCFFAPAKPGPGSVILEDKNETS